MPRLPSFVLRVGLAAAIALGVAAATSAQPALDARLGRLAAEVELTAEQRADLEALAARYADADRAALWSAASDLADVLTPGQIDALRAAAAARRAERPDRGARGHRGPRGMRGRRGTSGARGERPALSEADREALAAVRADVRAQTEALVADLRAGALTEAQFVDRVRAVREAGRDRAAALLPAEAAARLAQREARREAAQTARAEALSLTAEQQTALEAVAARRVREAPERPDLRPYLDDEGRLDREAMRELRRERRAAAREARSESREAAAAVLSDEQRDVVFLHRVLTTGARGRQGRRGGR